MTDLIITTEPTMSSREISDLVESRHSDVCRSIERLMKSGVISEYAPMPYTHPQNGQEYNEYHINKRDSYVVVAQLCPEFTARLVDRWQELESKQAMAALPNFNNPVEAARAWADEVEQKQAALLALEQAKPKADFYDAVTQSDDALSMDEVAKVLNIKGMGRNKLFKLLREKGVLQTSGARKNQPYQRHVDAGRFRLVETSWETGLGDTRINIKTVVLQKGLDYIRKLCEQ